MPSPNGSTPVFGYPYLLETDPPDVATASEDLALALETTLIPLAETSGSPAWTSYTPTWTSNGTSPSLGNGTLVGLYKKIGRLVAVRIEFIVGSTSTEGSGVYSFALPFAAATESSVSQLLTTYYNNNVNAYCGISIILEGASTTQPYSGESGSGGSIFPLGASQITGTGQVLNIQGTYESST